MFPPVLKRFVVIVFISAFALCAGAQRTYFVYLQTEDWQPFYIKINNKIMTSSPAGYLIVPKLTDGDYKLSVGFPKKEFPEEDFQISIDKKNLGFLLKNLGEKGWGLFNMQSFSVVMGGSASPTAGPSKNLQDDPFSKLLANVVKDSAILQKNEPLKEEVPVSPKVDTAAAKPDSMVAVTENAPLPAPPARLFNKRNKDGREMIYVDRGQNLNDTIRIFIPAQRSIVKPEHVDTGVVQIQKPSVVPNTDTASLAIEQPVSQMKHDTALAVSAENKNTIENKDSATLKTIEETKQPGAKSPDSVMKPGNKVEITKKDDIVVLPKVVQSSTTNSDCKSFASNEDFLRLRKKMASENSDDNMITVAKKTLHLKCFSTEQIKNLSFLLLTDQGKYMFFDMAYPFASDSDQYYTLQSQLTDSYYINRFKAMIHK